MPVNYCEAVSVMLLSQIKYNQLDFQSDSEYETFIGEKLIPAAMKIIDGFCNHNFQSNSGTVTLEGRGKVALLIPPPYIPVLGVSSCLVDGVNITTSIAIYDTYIIYNGGRFNENNANRKNVVLIMTYGYTSVPADVAYACAQICANMLAEMVRKKMLPDVIAQAVGSDRDINPTSATMRSSNVLTNELKDILSQYRYSHFEFT